MEMKRMLKIAYAITQFQDFVTDGYSEEDLFYINSILEEQGDSVTMDELNSVSDIYDGYGSDSLDDIIRSEYFKN